MWVKPPDVKCTSVWARGNVTAINSANNLEVDGMPRHVLDLRPVFIEGNDQLIDGDHYEGGAEEVEVTTDDSGTSDEYAECVELGNEVHNEPVEREPRALKRLQPFNNPGSEEGSPLRGRRNQCPPRQ